MSDQNEEQAEHPPDLVLGEILEPTAGINGQAADVDPPPPGEAEMRTVASRNGRPADPDPGPAPSRAPGGSAGDHVELELRERLTVLEAWRDRTDFSLALVMTASVVLAGLVWIALRQGVKPGALVP